MAAVVVCLLATSCGSGGSAPSQKLSGNTAVTLMLSSAANDQLSQFDFQMQTLTLTSQSGNTVSLLGGSQAAEAIHVNGAIELFNTAIVPQDVYTSATATMGGAQFTCIEVDSSGDLDTSTYDYGYVPNQNVTVTLPSPITITGDNMILSLDMQVLQSATYSSCYPSGTYSITPAFDISPLTLAAQPTNSQNGKITEYAGQVSALGTSETTFSVTPAISWGPVLEPSFTANAGTVYQGIGGFSDLQVGQFVDMDAAVQADGSLVATRVAVYDSSAVNVMIGPLLQANSASTDFYSYGRQQQGQQYTTQPSTLGVYSFSGTTSFQVSGQMNNVANLPFTASFTGSNMVPGQNMAVFSGPLTAYYGGETNAATTITLLPQVIDGTVLGESSSNGFTDYTVQLASYDLFPDLAVQPGQATLLLNPSIVEVYVDSNTQKVDTQPLAAGNTLRFYGLVFNDNGTLRMDCAQVNDGVAFTPNANANRSLQSGDVQTVHPETPAGLQKVVSVITRSN
jgi:hypothetical protein